ncbi:MAG TPA: tetratricopeptide repeat protein [Candidatus Methylomirabilis sp.]
MAGGSEQDALGAAYERNKQSDRAEQSFRRVLALKADHADALNYLGYMFAEAGVKLEESVSLIQRALVLEPQNAAFIDSLGWAYFKLGRVDDALRELKRAVALAKKEDPTIREHLGDAYFAKGMVREAIGEWERSLELDASNPDVQRKLREARDRLSREAR